MMVNPGELDKRIAFVKQTAAENENGYDEDPAETVVHTCWAKFTRTSGTEVVKANADFSEVKVRFLIRHTGAPIDRRMIVRYAGHNYEIVYLNDYEDAHEYKEIWCKQRTLEG